MARFACFPALLGKKKPKKEGREQIDLKRRNGTLKANVENGKNASVLGRPKGSFNVAIPFEIQGGSTYKVKVPKEENSATPEPLENAYEGEDEHECENSSMKRDFSDFDLQAQGGGNRLSVEKTYQSHGSDFTSSVNQLENEEGTEMMQSGHASDPGIGKASAWGSPKLKRSCSNVETRRIFKKIGEELSLSKSQSFEDMENLARGNFILQGIEGSPVSVMTSCSADKVMLKRRSSSQVLPSRSRKLWWKLFLWSHRNLHRPVQNQRLVAVKKSSNQRDGYSSDTVEVGMALSAMKGKATRSHKWESLGSSFDEAKRDNWNKFQGSTSGYWPRNQWVAFYSESSPLARVDEWVNTLDTQSALPPDDDDDDDGREVETEENIVYPPSPEKLTNPARRSNLIAAEDMLEANSVIQSLNSLSTVAHISGMGLKVIPNISSFSSLRTVNLSGNFIVYITPGCLPKSLHTLNLSRNKIAAIEGLRELTRLRVLDLSYNRISRIGQGLSNCTVVKELYLSGNKISDVDGLHRLLKLTVLDLSFNRITTTKALGQLVANYNSLLALNLLGNPIQSNLGDDQLRKTLSSLLPQLAYLNKQPIKPHRAREAVANSVAKAALGNSGWSARRKSAKRGTQSRSSERVGHRARHKSGSSHHRSPSTRR